MSILGLDEELHRQHLIKSIRNECVAIPCGTRLDLKEVGFWCHKHIGPKRPYHPIYEAERGWVDYFDGEWAHTLYTEEEVHLYWIADKNKRVQFQLTWTGER